ncbi:MAG: SGNH/GDSL hydrolase family protein [Candidatus Methylumidiphilus sp.]
MRRIIPLLSVFFCLLLAVAPCPADSRLIANLALGKPQTVVTYGTSLTAGGAWVDQLSAALQSRYPGLVTVINSAQAGMWSTWGVENLDERVLRKKPDAVLLEFAINDAHLANNVSFEQARRNLEAIVGRIRAANADTEVILMTMNPPAGANLERRPRIHEYYQIYREVAEEQDALLIDLYPVWLRIQKMDKDLFATYIPDGLHPAQEGDREVITPEILRALGFKRPSDIQ